MISRVLLSGLAAVGLVGFGVFGWRAIHHPPPASLPPVPRAIAVAKPPPVMVRLLVAGRDLSPGTFLRSEDLSTVTMAADVVPSGAEVNSVAVRSRLVGALVRRPILHEAPIDPADLLLAGDHGFLAAVLQPGMRAFTISPDQIVSDSGLIWPGDHLDLILTQQMPSGMPLAREVAAETILSNLRVLAIDRQLVVSEPAGERSPGSGETSPAAVTVEVSVTDAERLAVALRLGKVALALCASSPSALVPSQGMAAQTAGMEKPSKSTTVWAGGVMHALTGIQPPAATTSVHVFGGDGDKEYKF